MVWQPSKASTKPTPFQTSGYCNRLQFRSGRVDRFIDWISTNGIPTNVLKLRRDRADAFILTTATSISFANRS